MGTSATSNLQPQARRDQPPWQSTLVGSGVLLHRGNLATLPGYTYIYNKVSVNGVSTGSTTLRIFNGTTELTNGAAITADNIDFEAEFVRQL